MKKYIFLFLTLNLFAANAQCIREKGEWALNDCYCEETHFEFGNENQAKTFINGVKIGFIGDSGANSNTNAVLNMFKDENVEVIVHQGDLDYFDSSSLMEGAINNVFSEDFPFIYTIGNHDLAIWDRYQRRNRNRLMSVDNNLYCVGNLGVKSSCWYKGIQIVSTGTGTLCNGHEQFLDEELDNDDAAWKVCSFHKVHSHFQLGSKTDEVELDIYQKCIDHGALVMSAHDHVYGRTYPISDVFDKDINKEEPYIIRDGQSMIWVNGIGGYSRFSKKNGNENNPWWDSKYGRKTGSQYGGLICTFFSDRADCYYKTIKETVLDNVFIYKDTTCVPYCPECTKSWEDPVNDGCGHYCPMDNCDEDERCSSSAGYTCVVDSRCYIRCLQIGCVKEDQEQPTNWCGGTCDLPLC